MENHLHHLTKVLSMNIGCCERCPYVLKKKILKMPGVDSVTIDTEKNLVYVVGYIDATALLEKVAKLGKAVQLLPPDNQPRNESRGSRFAAPEQGKPHKNCCCQDGRHSKVEEKEEDHKNEAYVPFSINPRICRDYYCKTHPRSRVISDTVPAESSNFFGMGHMPFHGNYAPYGIGSHPYPGWYRGQQQQFGYSQPPRYLPPRPFNFQ